MINLKNFQPYTPDEPSFSGGLYLKAESGEDWYECQKDFEEETIKIVYRGDGQIVAAAIDVSSLFPSGMSVVEMDIKDYGDIDQDVRLLSYVDGKIVVRDDTITNAENKRAKLLSSATSKITVWQTKLMIGRKLTEAETAALNAWLDYIDALNALDLTTVEKVNATVWPAQPE